MNSLRHKDVIEPNPGALLFIWTQQVFSNQWRPMADIQKMNMLRYFCSLETLRVAQNNPVYLTSFYFLCLLTVSTDGCMNTY